MVKMKTKENLLTDFEADQLKAACKGFKDNLVVTVLLYTGMRVSEFIHMRRNWIDWKMGLIRIPKMQKCSCKYCERELEIMRGKKKGEVTKPSGIWKPKTFEAVRSIPIVPEAEQILKKFFSKHKKIRDLIPSRGSAYYRIRSWEESWNPTSRLSTRR